MADDYAELVKRLDSRKERYVPTDLGFYSPADARLDDETASPIEALVRERDALTKDRMNAMGDSYELGRQRGREAGIREAAEELETRGWRSTAQGNAAIDAILSLIDKPQENGNE